MLPKPKFQMSKQAREDFNTDCMNAVAECPQYNGAWDIELYTMGKFISAKALVKHWKRCDILFDYGYGGCLRPESVRVFDEYRKYRIANKAYKLAFCHH